MRDPNFQFHTKEIIKGDALLKMKDIKPGSVDLIFADLPYGKTKNPWDVIIPPEKLWPLVWRAGKPNAAVLFFGQDKFSAMMMLSDPNHRYNIIWEKTSPSGFLNSNRQPLRTHEDIMLFYKKQPTYNPQMSTGHKPTNSCVRKSIESDNYGKRKHNLKYKGGSTERYPTSIWKFASDTQKSSLHPTQKPVKLIEEGILTYSNKGDTVLDLCSGSGTLGEACINTNRNFIIIEKDPKNYLIGKKRVEEHFDKPYMLNLFET